MKRPFLPLVPVAVLLAPGLAACGERYHAEKNWTPLASTGKPDPDRSVHPDGRPWRAVIPESLAIELLGEEGWRTCQEVLEREGAIMCGKGTNGSMVHVELRSGEPPKLKIDPRVVRRELTEAVGIGRDEGGTWLYAESIGVGYAPGPGASDERRPPGKAPDAADEVPDEAAAGAPENASEAAPTEPRPSEDAGETPTEAGPPSRDDGSTKPGDG